MVDESKHDINSLLFTQLVMSFHAAAWQQMGKVTDPLTGKLERNLELAKNSIDILGMLGEKTKGNLAEHEAKFLQQVLTQLRMNYVEESNKPQPPPEDDKKDDSNKTAESENTDGDEK